MRKPRKLVKLKDPPLNKIDIKTSDNTLYFDILKGMGDEDNFSPNATK